MRISDWSSDVCSSDLVGDGGGDLACQRGGKGLHRVRNPCGVAKPALSLRDAGGDRLTAWRIVVRACGQGMASEPALGAVVAGAAAPRQRDREQHQRQPRQPARPALAVRRMQLALLVAVRVRSEEHTSELQSLMRISYAVFCLK